MKVEQEVEIGCRTIQASRQDKEKKPDVIKVPILNDLEVDIVTQNGRSSPLRTSSCFSPEQTGVKTNNFFAHGRNQSTGARTLIDCRNSPNKMNASSSSWFSNSKAKRTSIITTKETRVTPNNDYLPTHSDF